MTLTLLDLYNSTASQEWAMYDNDAVSDSEFEASLVIALNKAITDIYSSFEFPFRERTHIILTIPKVSGYDMPAGLIKKDSSGNYQVKYNSAMIKLIEDPFRLDDKLGIPEGFYIKNDKIVTNRINKKVHDLYTESYKTSLK